MARWTDSTLATTLAGDDVVLMADVSEAVGTRDRRVTLAALRTFLGAGITVGVTQASHGLSVGDVVRFDGTSYVQATADTAGNAEAVGVVTAVPDNGTFAYQTAGVASTLSGLTPGELYYLKDDGSLGTTAGTVDKPVLIATSATTAVLILAISGASGGGGGNAYYDLQLGFAGAPSAGAADVVLIPRAVTIAALDPGSVYVGTNPAASATIDVQVNGASEGSISITTGGVASWTVATDIVLARGDLLALVAPTPADSTLADVLVAFRGVAP